MTPIIRAGGRLVAYTIDRSERIELIAKGGRLVAFFDKQKNQTILSGGRFFGLGNQLMALLDECN